MGNLPHRQSASYVALLAAGHFLSDFYVTFLPGLLPVMIEKLGMSLTLSGLLVMVYSFASNIVQPICGYYIDKSGYTWLILLTIPVSAVFICLSGLAPSPAILFAFITLSGLASSLFHPLGSALLGKVSSEQNKGLAMAVFIGGGNFGVAAAPAIVIFFLMRYGPENLLWLAAPGLLLTLAYYFAGLHRIRLMPATTAGAAPPGATWYRSGRLLALNIVMGLRAWPQAALPNFLPVWLAQQGHSPTIAGSLLTIFLLGGALGSVGGGYIGDKLGRKGCIIGSLALCLPAMYLFLTSVELSPLTWAALFVSGAALQATLPSSIVWAQDLLPSNAAMASGMMLGLSFGLGGVGAAATGALADVIGLKQALLWTIAPVTLAIILTYFIPSTPAATFTGRKTSTPRWESQS
ncbi:MFS transporter [Sporolituus thermophilus]|uniref:MFS transporter, FSR family, fosmidomycin resistance protein n=1 Tax=Sporolituus thermophilus DSM 23256 TaxID=1123285 RepID=A0A1G7MCR7_9FIRM|nr:MFS transporter [Sporolituus thermophilus]SDF59587.1 MFS transporter, FSR family, fosmidomycin resistance protein [Sporolituus thermophilus DSM 23256]